MFNSKHEVSIEVKTRNNGYDIITWVIENNINVEKFSLWKCGSGFRVDVVILTDEDYINFKLRWT